MQGEYVAPEPKAEGFHCPNCGVYAHHVWVPGCENRHGSLSQIPELMVSFCARCGDYTLWVQEVMIFPSAGTAPLPHPKLPNDISVDFEEARRIVSLSPRGAAALLRLAIQKLCIHLELPGKNLNADIAALVKKGLPAGTQKALDTVRVVGNHLVHPGQIDPDDTPGAAGSLFRLVNFITEKMIAEPEEIEALYTLHVPDKDKENIEKRDAAPDGT